MQPINLVLSALDKLGKDYKPAGAHRYQASSPLRDDKKWSLSIAVKDDGTVLLKDFGHSGPTEDIVSALGLSMADLFPARPAPKPQPAAYDFSRSPDVIYSYRNELGVEIGQICRQNLPGGEKAVRPRYLDKGQWTWGKPPGTWPLYRLPGLLKADLGQWVWLCEGEKDTDTLTALGLVATTNPFGANQWLDAYNQYFIGRKVAILEDNDPGGQARSKKLAETLYPLATEIKIITPDALGVAHIPHADVSDALALDLIAPAELMGLPERLPAYSPPQNKIDRNKLWVMSELLATVFPPRKWLINDMLPEGLMLLAGKQKTGKSWLLLQLLLSLSTGQEFLGWPTRLTKCLLLSLEDSAGRFQYRAKLSNAAPDNDNLLIKFAWPNLITENGLDQLEEFIINEGVGFVAIDTFTRSCLGADQLKLDVIAPLLSRVQSIAMDYQMGVCITDHLRKGNGEEVDTLYDVYGSQAKTQLADVIWSISRDRDDMGRLRIEGRDLPQEEDFAMKFDRINTRWEKIGDYDETEAQRAGVNAGLKLKVIEAIRDLGSNARGPEIVTHTGLAKGYVYQTLRQMVLDGEVQTEGRGKPYTLPVPSNQMSLFP